MKWYPEILSRLIGLTTRYKVVSCIVTAVILVTAVLSNATIATAIRYKIDRNIVSLTNTVAIPFVAGFRAWMKSRGL